MIYYLEETYDIVRSEQAPTRWPAALMVTGNARAHIWRVTLLANGVPVDLTGAAAVAKFRRAADDITVTQQAAIDGNVISVQLAQDCYRYEGQLRGILEVTTGTGESTVVATAKITNFNIIRGASDHLSDPENIIPSLAQIINQMDDMAEVAVKYAEAELGRYAGEEKWRMAIELMRAKGFDVDSDVVVAALKAAWETLDLAQITAGIKEAKPPDTAGLTEA